MEPNQQRITRSTSTQRANEGREIQLRLLARRMAEEQANEELLCRTDPAAYQAKMDRQCSPKALAASIARLSVATGISRHLTSAGRATQSQEYGVMSIDPRVNVTLVGYPGVSPDSSDSTPRFLEMS
eukprot:4504961-Prymnesium_polylepis.1